MGGAGGGGRLAVETKFSPRGGTSAQLPRNERNYDGEFFPDPLAGAEKECAFIVSKRAAVPAKTVHRGFRF